MGGLSLWKGEAMKNLPTTSLIVGLLLCISVIELPAQSEQKKPTFSQLQLAKDAFAKFGKVFIMEERVGPHTVYVFIFPVKFRDEDVKNVPDVPFLFGLDFTDTQLTEAGLKAFANLKNLRSLCLRD